MAAGIFTDGDFRGRQLVPLQMLYRHTVREAPGAGEIKKRRGSKAVEAGEVSHCAS